MRDSGREVNAMRERTDCEWTTQIAGYVSSWLGEHFYSRAELNQFLMRHPCYESHRYALLRECRLSCIACVLIAIRMAHGASDFDAGFVDYLQEQSVRPGRKRKGVRNRQILELTDGEIAKIADYVRVHQYISLKAKNGDPAGSSTVHSCITSIGYMTVNSVIEQGSPCSDAFGSTVHLLHELVAPVLRSALESTLRDFRRGAGIRNASIHREDQAQVG